MSVNAITARMSASRGISTARRGVSRRLSQLPGEMHAKSKAKVKAEGSCAGMVSWSLNQNPAVRKNIKAEGSCAGMVSWSLNQSAVDRMLLN